MDDSRRLFFVGLPLSLAQMAHADAPAAPADATPGGMSISGSVKHSLQLSVDALRASKLASDTGEIVLTNPSGERKGVLTGYRGMRLTDLLDQAQIEILDHNSLKRSYVVVRARDEYTVVFSCSELYNTEIGPGVLVLVEKDGERIGDREGPLTLVSRRDIHTGPRHVRWLQSVEVRRI